MTKLSKKIAELEKKLEKLYAEREINRAKTRFPCACGKTHAFKDCEVVQTYWYEAPYSCSAGDTWHPGERQIVCPKSGVRNRLLFFGKENEKFGEDFWYMFRDTFKDQIDDFKKLKTPTFNNMWFQENVRKLLKR